MMFIAERRTGRLLYEPGIERDEEAVISSHFMHDMCRDPHLCLYAPEDFSEMLIGISRTAVHNRLLPILKRASEEFASRRARAAKRRAIERIASSARRGRSKPDTAHFITELLFDRQFRSAGRETCDRQEIFLQVEERIAHGAPIMMAIAALPYKIASPLKSRGKRADLAEVNFLLGLYEIARAVEILYREEEPEAAGVRAMFTVVCDGRRFEAVTHVANEAIETYQTDLARWRRVLGLESYVEFIDYKTLLRSRLPQSALESKETLRRAAEDHYSMTMWTLFRHDDMASTLRAAARNDPDPETGNPEGRFVSLVKSLVYTVEYRCLAPFTALPKERFCALYRELTGHMFEPFCSTSSAPSTDGAVPPSVDGASSLFVGTMERLRQTMLREVWEAAIAYIAEIKSDREQSQEPVSACLPYHLRWTIHAKPGQLGLMMPYALGKPVSAWAGSAVFKRTHGQKVRLCTLPVLALEGVGAAPVTVFDDEAGLDPNAQPLFYIYPGIDANCIDDFLSGLDHGLVRKRRG